LIKSNNASIVVAPNWYCIVKHAAESIDLQKPNLLIKQAFKHLDRDLYFPLFACHAFLPDICASEMENTYVIHEKYTEKKEMETY